MQCFLCSKAKAIIGQVRQRSSRTVSQGLLGLACSSHCQARRKHMAKSATWDPWMYKGELPTIPLTPSHTKEHTERRQACLVGFYGSLPQSSSDWFIQELQVQGSVGIFPPFHDVNRILGKTTCHCMKVKKIWVKSGLSLLKIYQSHLEVTATLSNNTRC